MNMRIAAAIVLSTPLLVASCSTFAVGKKATKDGSVLISHSDDGDPTNDARLIYVPAMDHTVGAKRPVFYSTESFPRYVGSWRGPGYEPDADTKQFNITKPIGFIDQVAHTYGYQSSTYGVINEHGVGVAESTCGAMFGTCGRGSNIACEPGRKIGEALLSIDELSYIAMERTKTSREAVELMGALASKYGFYGPPDSFEGSGESLIVGGPDEAWVFQILSDPQGKSAIWAAKRVPDTDMTVVANMFTIREVDSTDKDNYILSPNIYDVPKLKGWWTPGQPFDFTKMYSGGEYAHKYYSGRRMWGGFRQAAPSLKLAPEYDDIRYKAAYPWSVKPDKLADHKDLIAWHRDWYGGTQFDMTKGLQAGPFGTPDRFGTNSKVKGHWERSIALYRTNSVYVQQLKHDAPGQAKGTASVAWFGAGPAHYTPFVPLPAAVTQTLSPFQEANPKKFERQSLNWATRQIMSVCQIRFDKMHPVVEAAQKKAETDGQALVLKMQQGKVPAGLLNDLFEKHAESVRNDWNELALKLTFMFSDNTDIATMHGLGYPDSWLEGSGFKDGPPDVPVEDQCPPNCPRAGPLVV